MNDETTKDWLNRRNREKKEQNLINEIYAEHPDVKKFMETKEKGIKVLLFTGLGLHFLWFGSCAFSFLEYPGLITSLFTINGLLLLGCCMYYVRPMEYTGDNNIYTTCFHDVTTLFVTLLMLVMGGIIKYNITKSTDFPHTWNRYRELFSQRLWYGFLGALLLLFYLLLFVVTIILFLPKNRKMMDRFSDLLKKQEMDKFSKLQKKQEQEKEEDR